MAKHSDRKYILKRDGENSFYGFCALLAIYLLKGRFDYEVAVDWATKIFKNIELSDVIITFNWDVIPEFLMAETKRPFFRYDWTGDRKKIIKLNGSMDLIEDPNI